MMKKCLLLFAVPLGLVALFVFGFIAVSHAAAEPAALVRIDVRDRDDLARVARLGISIYARLVSPAKDTYILAPLTSADLDALTRAGISFTVVDPAIGDSRYRISYFPTAEQLAYFGDRVLAYDGRHAILRAADDTLTAPAFSGATIHDLVLHPLITPEDDRPLDVPRVTTPDPVVQEIIDQVELADASDWVGGLSGEWPVVINGNPYTLATRYTPAATAIEKATRYTHDFLEDLGLMIDYDYYTLPGIGERRNVIADQPGVIEPDRIIMLTAHLDSITYQSPLVLAPGADDNASGSAAVLIAADILSQYDFGCTLRYALFTGEEQGLYGSKAYAAEAYARGDDIEAVLNLDMIGYNGDADLYLELHTRPSNAADQSIAALFDDVVDVYNIGLWTVIYDDGLSFSDHSPFWGYGYPAILAIEEYYGDFNPYYHSNGDLLGAFDMDYFVDAIKAALGTVAHMGCGINPVTPTPTPSQTASPTPTASPTATQTPTPGPTPVYLYDTYLPVMIQSIPAASPNPGDD